MVRFDFEKFKYLNSSDFRVLTAVEMGMKNHEFVPSQLLYAVANCKGGKTFSTLRELCRQKLLIYEKSSQGEGYRLTFTGYDVLALNVLTKRDVINQFGSKIGVGKESDIYIACDNQNKRYVIKFHRLGRNSFRKVKEKRDYMGTRRHTSWLYLSRLSATKEFEFLKILHRNGFPVPKPIDCNRHCIVMELIEGYPFCQVNSIQDAPALYNECINLIIQFAQYGLIHSDFSEYNLIYCENYKNENAGQSQSDNEAPNSSKDAHYRIVVIDFPQMVSTDHINAEYYFNRDVKCIRDLFKRKFNFIADEFPALGDVVRTDHLDKEVFASGFNKQMDSELIELFEDISMGSGDDGSYNEPSSPNNSNNPNIDQDTASTDKSMSIDESKSIGELPPVEKVAACDEEVPSTLAVPLVLEHPYVDPNNLDQIYELLSNEYIVNPPLNLNPTEERSMAYSTFTRKEISEKIRSHFKVNQMVEKHKKALKLAVKAGDSYRSRLRKENKARVKESLCDEL